MNEGTVLAFTITYVISMFIVWGIIAYGHFLNRHTKRLNAEMDAAVKVLEEAAGQ